MKLLIRLLFIFSVFTFVPVGCVKSSDIENLQEQIDTMKSDQIGSIESQIESIRKSIASLEATDTALQEYINALQEQITLLKNSEQERGDEIEELQNAVETLQKKDEDLQAQINALKEYIDSLISDTEKWANATFATIDQYNSVSKILSDILVQIKAIEPNVTAPEETLTTYEVLVSSLNDSVTLMTLDIETLKKQMKDVLARVQSVIYVPKFSDGKAVMTYYTDPDIIAGSATFDFEVRPAYAAADIVNVWKADNSVLSMNAIYNAVTKTPSTRNLEIVYVAASGGYLTVIASGKSLRNEFFDGLYLASARLCISDGVNDITSEYVQIVPEHNDFIVFEDSMFETCCLSKYDSDGNKKFTEEEALAVTRLECANSDISSLSDITHFCNLEYIDVSGNSLTSLDLSQNPKLKKVKVNDNKLQTLDLTGLLDLESLDCSNNELDNINVDDYVRLDTLDCAGNNIRSLNVDNNVNLVSLDCSDNALSSLCVARNTVLENLSCSANEIASLNVDNNVNLVSLDCSSNSLVDIDVQKNTFLKNLNVSSNTGIIMLVLKNNTRLETLDASKTGLISLDTFANKALQYLNVSSTSLAALDVSNNASLETLKVSRTVKLIVSEGLNSSIYQIGQYVSIAGVAGVVCSASSSVAKIMSTTETYTYWDYYGTTTGATSEDDGVANTDKIASGSPAVRWCRVIGAEWYLPARRELEEIWGNYLTLNATLSAIEGTRFNIEMDNSDVSYWSSTEADRDYAFIVSFPSGYVSRFGDKSRSRYVRAVRAL